MKQPAGVKSHPTTARKFRLPSCRTQRSTLKSSAISHFYPLPVHSLLDVLFSEPVAVQIHRIAALNIASKLLIPKSKHN